MRHTIIVGRPVTNGDACLTLNQKDMQKKIESLKKTRKKLLELVDDLSVAEMNQIPQGFVNNVAWNLGHMVASQQGICYRRAGLPMHLPDAFFAAYKPDTKPEGFIGSEQIDNIKMLLAALPNRFEQDYNDDVFSGYVPWVNRYDVELRNIDDAMNFVLFHEGLHLGYIMALKRATRR